MSHNIIEHIKLGVSRVATQYTLSPKFLAFVEKLLGQAEELESLLDIIAQQSDIDIAKGVNLDVIGDIVGIGRIIDSSLPLEFFGFQDGVPPAFIFGEDGNVAIGRRFREEGEAAADSSILNDIEYRMLIRAKIIKNHAKGTGEDLIAGLQFLFNTDVIVVDDNLDMSIDVAIGRDLTFLEKALFDLDILPRPVGVRINQRATFVVANYFGFSDQPGALSFNVGVFSEEF